MPHVISQFRTTTLSTANDYVHQPQSDTNVGLQTEVMYAMSI